MLKMNLQLFGGRGKKMKPGGNDGAKFGGGRSGGGGKTRGSGGGRHPVR